MLYRTQLSILIPTYNVDCTLLVKTLRQQAMSMEGLYFEIIVADDGSTLSSVINKNLDINQLSHCRYIIRKKNVGRSQIRNFLTSMAHYTWLLFVDSDMQIVNNVYLTQYLKAYSQAKVIYGGNCVQREILPNDGTLRYYNEKKIREKYTATERNKNPYQHFTTSNFLVARSVMIVHPFNSSINSYGYEDVLFGKELKVANIRIYHIDNPVGFCHFEDNESYLTKTKEAMQTLYQYRKEIEGYSPILDVYQQLKYWHLVSFIKLLFRLTQKMMLKHLTSSHPSLFIFKCYKLGYFCTLNQ